jgi:hypothetical protein
MRLRRVFAIVILAGTTLLVSQISRAGETLQEPAARELLQGNWTGEVVGEQGGPLIVVTIVKDSLRFYRDESFWFETKFILSGAGESRKLRATILRGAEAQGESIAGKVVPAFYRIDGETLELAPYDEDEPGAPKTFKDQQGTRYRLSRAVDGGLDGQVDDGKEAGSALIEGPLP